MPLLRRCLLVLLTAAAPPCLAAASGNGKAEPPFTIEIRGVEGEFAGVSRDSLELSQYTDRDLTLPQLRRFVARGEEEIRRGLEPWGYYDVQVKSELAEDERGRPKAIFHVTLGERVIVRQSSVEVNGPAIELEAVQRALRAFEPREGEALDHWLYEIRKSEVSSTLQAWGFLDAELQRHRVEVTRATRSATIDLAWDSGVRYRMGELHFDGNQLPEEFLARYAPWEPGAEYHIDELLQLQQRLVDADYFSVVSVTPGLEQRENGVVPVDVQLVPARRTVYTASAFVSTDSGPGGSLGIQRRWVNQRGHKAGMQVEYATRREAYSLYYRIPRPGIASRLYSFAAGYVDEETDTSTSRLRKLSASEQNDDWHGYARTIGLQYVDGNYEVGYDLMYSRLLYAELQLIRRRADDLLFPRRGVSVAYTARLASDALLSDTPLASVRADLKWVRPAGPRSRWLLRASAGALNVRNFDRLTPELRFFAGGDRSVRGFDYQAIGERQPLSPEAIARLQAEKPRSRLPDYGVVGGRYLLTASGEFEHWFREQWGVAAFVDGGDAFHDQFNLNVGAGVGVRWRSPVGIVRLDFAVPVRTDIDQHGLRFHVMIGPDL